MSHILGLKIKKLHRLFRSACIRYHSVWRLKTSPFINSDCVRLVWRLKTSPFILALSWHKQLFLWLTQQCNRGIERESPFEEICWNVILFIKRQPLSHRNLMELERKSRTLKYMMNVLLISYGLTQNLWGESYSYN